LGSSVRSSTANSESTTSSRGRLQRGLSRPPPGAQRAHRDQIAEAPPALAASLVDIFVQRFRDESRILYRLSQGNLHIVRSIAAGTTQAPVTGALVPYMVLEWLEGRSLQNDFTVRRTLGESGGPLTIS